MYFLLPLLSAPKTTILISPQCASTRNSSDTFSSSDVHGGMHRCMVRKDFNVWLDLYHWIKKDISVKIHFQICILSRIQLLPTRGYCY